jgi:hypothetical protein
MSTPDDVRWEKVEQIKLVLNSGTYPVPPERVAEKLVEHMLNLENSRESRTDWSDPKANVSVCVTA